MKRVGIIAKTHYADSKHVLEELIPWLQQREKEIFVETDTAAIAGHTPSYQKSKIPGLVDMIIVMGGDGTLLSVARLMNGSEIPILGVNLGGLGFLTEVTLAELYPTLEKVFNKEFVTEDRILLKVCVYRQGERVAQSFCLNDVVVSKGTLARLITMHTYINGKFVTSLRGDGLIVATPTGSTAYSLSAGGPIINPTVNALVFTPISPHILSNRPIVIPADAMIEVILKSQDEGATVTFDGQVGFSLRQEDVVDIRTAEHRIKLIHSPEKNYYEVLRKKLRWGEG